MDFAAVIKVIPMDKSIHTAFKNSSFWIFRHFLPVIGKFLPGLLGVAIREITWNAFWTVPKIKTSKL